MVLSEIGFTKITRKKKQIMDSDKYPFSKELYDRALELGINQIAIVWSSFNDENRIKIESNQDYGNDDVASYLDEVYDWVNSKFGFESGAAHLHGENVAIDLTSKKFTVTAWKMQQVFDDEEQIWEMQQVFDDEQQITLKFE